MAGIPASQQQDGSSIRSSLAGVDAGLLPSPDGMKLYAGVGSSNNIAESGMAVEEGRAAVYELDLANGSSRILQAACAIRRAWHGANDRRTLDGGQRARRGLGDETPPDYLTSVRSGGFYGWPIATGGGRWTIGCRRIGAVAKAITRTMRSAGTPRRWAASHSTLGRLLPGFPEGMAIIWAARLRRPQHAGGYKVVFVPFANGRPVGPPRDISRGFSHRTSEDYGRPVGVTLGPDGSVLVADDVGD